MSAHPLFVSCVVLLATSAVACGGSESAEGDRPLPDAGSLDAKHDSIFEAARDTILEDSGVTAETIIDAPPPNLDFAPVCGCDDVTYWNADQAAAQGASVCDTHECAGNSASTGACGASIDTSCRAGATCVTNNYSFCFFPDSFGHCWYIPPDGKCPTDTGVYLDCTTSTCINYCQAVKTGKLVEGC